MNVRWNGINKNENLKPFIINNYVIQFKIKILILYDR